MSTFLWFNPLSIRVMISKNNSIKLTQKPWKNNCLLIIEQDIFLLINKIKEGDKYIIEKNVLPLF